MTTMRTMQMAAALLLAAGSVATAQSLATGEPNNGSGGVWMDLTALSGPLDITSFDIAYTGTSGTTVDVEVWIRPGTYVGFETSSAGWTLTQTVTGTRAGAFVLSPLSLTTPIELAPNQTTAVYLQALDTGGIRYNGTSANPPQTTWQNADLSLYSEHSTTASVAFGGSIFTPRTFAGVIHYLPGSTDPGACCFKDGTCQEILGTDCITQGGIFQGPNTTCAGTTCPPTGACCMADGSCTIEWESGCNALGGSYQGDGTDCGTITCPIKPIFPESHAASNIFPFDMTPGTTMHQVFSSDLFMGINQGEPVVIEELAFSPTGTVRTFDGQVALRLGYTQAIPGATSGAGGLAVPDLAGGGAPNAIGPMHEFYAQQHVLFNMTTGDPEVFDFVFIGDPFEYDPTQGNLLMEIYIPTIASGIAASRGAGNHLHSRAYHRHNGVTGELTGQAGRTMFTISFESDVCYANCDGSTTEPILTVDDFTCFINEFAQAQTLPVAQQIEHYANCDGSTTEPILTVDDFTCFINAFAQGCP